MKCTTILVFMLMMFSAVSAGAVEKSVKLATLAWEPYIGPTLKNKGYVYEIVEEAFKKAGYSTEIVFYPWARALINAEYGDVDGVFPEYFDESRTPYFVFSDPFPGGPVGLYKRKDTVASYPVNPQINQIEALRGLRQFRFGIVRGYVNTPDFDAATFLRKEEVFSDELNIKKLYNGRIQFMFIDKHVAEYLIQHKFPEYKNELEFMEPPLENKLLYIAFSKKGPDFQQKLAAFNSGLQQIINDGTLTRILKQHGIHERLPFSSPPFSPDLNTFTEGHL